MSNMDAEITDPYEMAGGVYLAYIIRQGFQLEKAVQILISAAMTEKTEGFTLNNAMTFFDRIDAVVVTAIHLEEQ